MLVIKTEGLKDGLAIPSMPGFPRGEFDIRIISNAFGCKENPANVPLALEYAEGNEVWIIHDCDKPGQEGATYVEHSDGTRRPGWAPAMAARAASCKNIVLPYPIEETDGKDLRDWINEGATWDQLKALADAAPEFDGEEVVKEIKANEKTDDPYRLARVNIAEYSANYGGAIVFWHGEFWKYKAGKYQSIASEDLRASVTKAIKDEFNRAWEEDNERYEDWLASDEYDETQDKGPPKAMAVTQRPTKDVIASMEAIARIPSSTEMPSWLGPRGKGRKGRQYISMKNGLLDLEAVIAERPEDEWLIPHTPKWFSTVRLEFDFNPRVQYPKFTKYMKRALENDGERIELLQEWAGYLLVQGNEYQRFMILEGDGSNGKTVLFAVLTAMLGQDNVSNLAMEKFGGQFDLGATHGKLLNIAGDIEASDGLAEGVIKTFTDGLPINVDRKHRSPISFIPTAKLMGAWNVRPRIRDKSNGLWRRMIVVPFNSTIEKHEIIRGMDSAAWWIETGEMPGILMWAIAGLMRLRKQRDFTESQVCEDAKKDFRIESNPAKQFLTEQMKTCEHGSLPSSEIFAQYRRWCEESNCRPLGNRQFFKEMNRVYPEAERVRSSLSRRPWEYRGVQFSYERAEPSDEGLF